MDLHIYAHSSKISFRQTDQSIDDCLIKNKDLFQEKSNYDHWYFDQDQSSVILLPKDIRIILDINQSVVSILNYSGKANLDLKDSKVSIMKGELQADISAIDSQIYAEHISGELTGQLTNTKAFLSSKIQTINLTLESSNTDILVNESEFANCTLHGNDSSAIFKVLDLEDLVLQSQIPEKSVHGNNSKYFVSITGRFNTVEWKLNSEEWTTKTDDLKIMGQDTIDQNDDIMELFNQFEDKIEANYEVFSKEDKIEKQISQASSAATESANSQNEEHIYELYRNKEITFEELQDMLEKGM